MMKTKAHSPAPQQGSTTTLKLDPVRRAWLVSEANARGTNISGMIRDSIDTLRARSMIERHIRASIARNVGMFETLQEFEAAMKARGTFTRTNIRTEMTFRRDAPPELTPITMPVEEFILQQTFEFLHHRELVARWHGTTDLDAYYAAHLSRIEFYTVEPDSLQFEPTEKNNTDASFGGQGVGVDRSKEPPDMPEAKIE